MKNMKKIVSLLLAIALLVSAFQGVIQAADGTTTVTVDNVYGSPEGMVDVNVSIENNPGILGAIFTLDFDEGLILKNAISGSAFSALTMSKPGVLTSPCQFVWDGESLNANQIKDGIILTLTFEISKDAVPGENLGISLSYKRGDILNTNLKPVTVETVAGNVAVIDYTPGDLNDDNRINALDIVLMRRYITGGYGVTINEKAADINDDGKINTADIILIRRYIAGGYGIKLLPSHGLHEHTMESVAAKKATCKEEGNIAYWHCTFCNNYYLDEDGIEEIELKDTVIAVTDEHDVVVDEAVAATTTSTGLTEGSHCGVCEKVLVAQEVIPMIKGYSIEYHIAHNDSYLASIQIENKNPNEYTAENGLVLKDLIVKGYNFKGWYTSQTGGMKVTEISVGSKGNKELYAQWEKVPYTVTFDSPDVPWDSITYTVDTGATLRSPECYGYTFVGWSNDDGFIIDRIKPGTTGHMTLHANWTSNRNRATSYNNYGTPIIIEDDTKGQFLFVYDIGRIDNVPLYAYTDVNGNSIGANGTALNIDMTYEVNEQFGEVEAKEVIETVADATTRSSGWTLSEEWNDLYSEGTEYSDKQIKSEERTDSQGNVVGGNYFVSNSQGGSSFISTESGGSTSSSSKVTTDKSFGINASYDKSTEKYCDATLSAENKTEVSAGVEAPVGIAKVSAGVKNTTTIGAEVSSGRKDNTAFHIDGNYSSSVGTVDINDSSSYFNVSANQSSNWNSTTGYEKSYQTSINTTVSEAIAQEIAKTTNYNISKSLGGGSEHNTAVSGTTSNEKGYSNSIQVSEHYSKTTTKHVKYSNSEVGYYRVVMAGTVHVYGVVGYDIATSSYYTYTYNVLADETFEYVDYSKERATFDDCENGVVTFEVPYEVNEYILGVTSETEGLEIGLDGTVNAFEAQKSYYKLDDGEYKLLTTKPDDWDTNYNNYFVKENDVFVPVADVAPKFTKFDGTVVVPQYHADTQPGTENVALKTKAISSTAFKNKTEIKTVILPIYVTEIPEGAFEGCTNLETVIAYGVTKIDKYAFKGCTSLKKFYIDNYITELGTNAFENVPEIAVMAYKSSVADSAIKSGAKKITVDVSKIKDSFDNKSVTVDSTTEYFAIVGNGGEYNNLKIDSKAKETLISKIKFVNNSDTPIIIDSQIATLASVSVENSPVYALQLRNDSTDLKLYGEINLSSQSKNTVISKNVTLSKSNNSITSKLNITGKYFVCGEVINKESFLNVEPEIITSDEYEMYISPVVIAFDSNNGVEIAETKIVYNYQKYGTLPTPQRECFEFIGWYTEPENGELITADTTVNVDTSQTLYAHWKQLTSTLVFDANGGSVSKESKVVYIGETVGDLPTPTKDYHDFLGWFTEPDGNGTQVTSDYVFDETKDITLYAHWSLKEISGWVLESKMPSDAELISEKWKYTLREYTENTKSSSLSGWTHYDTKRTGWGATIGPVYSDPNNGSRNVSSERYVSSTTTHYTFYHRYGWGTNVNTGVAGYVWGSDSQLGSGSRHEIDLTYDLTKGTNIAGNERWRGYACPHCGADNMWFGRGTYVENHYSTRWYYQDPIYTYYFYRDLADQEAFSDPTGQANVSNVVKYVQYREK